MRLLISFEPKWFFSENQITKHDIQGFIYGLFKSEEKKVYIKHDSKQFKFFCFSDIFPFGNFKPHIIKKLIISSPSKTFIKALYHNISPKKEFHLGGCPVDKIDVKIFDLKPSSEFISGSPIVLYKDNQKNEYFSFKKHGDLNFFLNRLQDNALKKYNIFYKEELVVEHELFSDCEFSKEVVIPNRKGNRSFIHIGSTWKKIGTSYLDKKLVKFYKFIMDAGLGEKNSMGFGFLNPL
ncbi:MAG: CRISPR-associated endoribonuclease Cas6 [Candidatus Heimdallarchaeaceae archaeon]